MAAVTIIEYCLMYSMQGCTRADSQFLGHPGVLGTHEPCITEVEVIVQEELGMAAQGGFTGKASGSCYGAGVHSYLPPRPWLSQLVADKAWHLAHHCPADRAPLLRSRLSSWLLCPGKSSVPFVRLHEKFCYDFTAIMLRD